ncbi:U-box domain-containing protein 9-like isoform X2 [Pistacia vera]|uniref:U-box domain-containing protein 9-like isoform X2 n=1 Tax=Pistacia vera TaxID=55513 RepID=UPI0012635E51|nr:U-box domain-containing protein 9-like isoform X2 [Pistacia vera]
MSYQPSCEITFLGLFVVQSFNLFYQFHFQDWSFMANPEAQETDHSRNTVFELKKELQRLVKTILDEDDYGMHVTDEALRVLSCLKEFNLKKSHSLSVDCLDVPEVFRCPISGEIMADPVVLANGLTFDRPCIEKWLNEGNRSCPQTHQVLSHTVLTPNQLVREIISQWCQEHGIELPKAIQDIDEDFITDVDRSYLTSLLEKMSSSLSDQKEAAKELRLLTKRMPSFRALFSESTDTILQLLNPLSPGRADTDPDPDLQEDLITTVLNLSIHDNNKKLVAEDPLVIPLLIDSLKTGTIETRRNAAAALFTLSALDSNKLIIGKSGAVRVIVGKIINHTLVDELLAILSMLSSHQIAIEEMGELGAVPCLLSIIRESTCERNKENCVAILYNICFNDRSKLREIGAEENANHTLSRLAQDGTSRAKRKANAILERLNKAALIAHTA